MAKGFKHGAGGTSLNFKVKTYPSETELSIAKPRENTIGVITTTTMTRWVLSATEPKEPEVGMIWISLGNTSAVEFNALKNNTLQVYPLSVKQYVSGAWVAKTAMSYQGGKWVNWTTWLYNSGNECTDLTGGWESVAADIIDNEDDPKALTVTPGTDHVKLTQESAGRVGLYVTKNKISVGGFSSLRFKGEIYNTTNNEIVIAVMSDRTLSGIVASKTYTQLGELTVIDEKIIDLPSSGEYYIGIAISSTDDKYIIMRGMALE